VRKGDDLTTFIVRKVLKNPEALTFRILKGLFRPVAGILYLYLYCLSYMTLGIDSVVKQNTSLSLSLSPFG
jgi:hypothetical protein